MPEWLILLLIAVLCAIAGTWVLLRRAREEIGPPAVAASIPGTGTIAMATSGNEGPSPAIHEEPSTKVMPMAEDMPVARLEFDGPPGAITLRSGEVVIGRHSEDDVRVKDVRVSRHHARLVVRGDGSSEIHNLTAVRPAPNPMLVNGENRAHSAIGDGDVVTLGGVSFKFRQVAA